MVTLTANSTPMPESLVHYWTMWNEPSLGQVRGHLDQAVTEDVLWADPKHYHRGRAALEANVKELRTAKPQYRFVIASEIDAHNDRLRYDWHMMRNHRVLLRGLDVVTLDGSGLIARVDGFFGETLPVQDEGSGVPDFLRFFPA